MKLTGIKIGKIGLNILEEEWLEMVFFVQLMKSYFFYITELPGKKRGQKSK